MLLPASTLVGDSVARLEAKIVYCGKTNRRLIRLQPLRSEGRYFHGHQTDQVEWKLVVDIRYLIESFFHRSVNQRYEEHLDLVRCVDWTNDTVEPLCRMFLSFVSRGRIRERVD